MHSDAIVVERLHRITRHVATELMFPYLMEELAKQADHQLIQSQHGWMAQLSMK